MNHSSRRGIRPYYAALPATLLPIILFLSATVSVAQRYGWTATMKTIEIDAPGGLDVDDEGNICVAGSFTSGGDFDPGPDSLIVEGNGGYDFFVMKLDARKNLLWFTRTGGLGFDRALDLTTDPDGNVITTGSFETVTDFDPGPDIHNLTWSGDDDIFIQKLNGSGEFVWARSIGGTLEDFGSAVATDRHGNVYVTGKFSGAVDFDPGEGTHILFSSGLFDSFILKLDPNGNFLWAGANSGRNRDGFSEVESSNSIAVDADDNVLLTGSFSGTIDFDPRPEPDRTEVRISRYTSAYVQKLNTDGELAWVALFEGRPVSGETIGSGKGVTVDADGNVYSTGSYMGPFDFNPGPDSLILESAGTMSSDLYLHKLDRDGNAEWVLTIGPAGTDAGDDVRVGPDGDLYLTGRFSSVADFDPSPRLDTLRSRGSTDPFFARFDSEGMLKWVVSVGSRDQESGYAIDTDQNGNVYAQGRFFRTVDFDFGAGIDTASSTGSSVTGDLFVIKIDQSVGSIGPTGNSASTRFSLFPNPVSDHLTIQPNDGVLKGTLTLYNALGIPVMVRKLSGEAAMSFDLEGVPSGTLFPVIDAGEDRYLLPHIVRIDTRTNTD